MNFAIWLERIATLQGDAPALCLGAQTVENYAAFQAKAAAVGGALVAQGIQPGDRVAVFAKNVPEYLIAWYGIWRTGSVIVPINAKLHPREAAFILEDAGATMAFVTADVEGDLAKLTNIPLINLNADAFTLMTQAPPAPLVHREASDLAWLFYTSGTTGRPKGVRITFGMLQAMSLNYIAEVDAVNAEDGVLYAAPISHAAGIYNMVHVLRGTRHVFPTSGGFDAAEVLALAQSCGPLSVFMAPTMVRRFTDVAAAKDDKAVGVRTIIYAGGPMYSADIIDAVDWFGPKFVQIYGQGECPMGISVLSRADVADRTHPRWRERLGSVGRAQAAVEIATCGADGASLAQGEIGEIMVRGAMVMPGYWENPEATAKTLRDGWLMTGDVGSLDADGYLTLTDRSKDLIISGGSNIYPREVEEVLLTHPSVQEVAVVGQQDADWGEIVVAFVVAKDGLDQAALDAHCRDNIARFKRPKAYRALPELPKNNYGKVLKTELRALLKGD